MENLWRIEHRTAFSVLGIQSRLKQGSETSELFAGIWEKFERESKIIEPLSLNNRYYGVNFPVNLEEISEYLAGMMVPDNSAVPGGMVKRNVPEGNYAVFECTVEGIGLCFQYIFTKWLPAASVNFNPVNPVFEEYPERNSPLPVRIHIPLITNV